MADRSQIACQTPACRGILGAWANGNLIPAGHLVGGRDWYIAADGRLLIRCSFCNSWHEVVKDAERLNLCAIVAR
jgi:hypothetical protein